MTLETIKNKKQYVREHCRNDDKEEEGYLGTGGEHWSDEAGMSGKCNPQERQRPNTQDRKKETHKQTWKDLIKVNIKLLK